MTVAVRKFNPGFLSDKEIVESFCVRKNEFTSIVEVLRECTGNSNTHQLVVGARGSGKTSLLLRVAAEIRRDSSLSQRFYPVVFAEESYEVSSVGEFWLECLYRLAEQVPHREGEPDLWRSFGELRQIQNDQTLGDRCLGAIQDFADRQGKRLVLFVENLNMLFQDIGDPDSEWRLRHTLQTEPRVILLASATSRFEGIDSPERAFYDLFRTLTLRPLAKEECQALWRSVSGQSGALGTTRAMQIISGGSPRLLTILAGFGAQASLHKLMSDLLNLVDDHTEYFKSHLDALPQQERRVYLAVAQLWKPATAREIAERARLDTSKCSAQLGRLARRGTVEVVGGSKRRKHYYVSERLYNIYYLIRRARGPAPLIEAVINFMEAYYSPTELKEWVAREIHNASQLDGQTPELCRRAYEKLAQLPSLEPFREDLLSLATAAIAGNAERLPDTSKLPPLMTEPFGKVADLMESGRLQDAVEYCDEIVRCLGACEASTEPAEVSLSHDMKAHAQMRLQWSPRILASIDEDVKQHRVTITSGELSELEALALSCKASNLGKLGRQEDALSAWNEVVDRYSAGDMPRLHPLVAIASTARGNASMALNRPKEALSAWEYTIERFGESNAPAVASPVARALGNKPVALATLDRLEDALVAFDEFLQFCKLGKVQVPDKWVFLGVLNKATWLERLDRPAKAIAALDELECLQETTGSPPPMKVATFALLFKADLLARTGRYEEALDALDDVVQTFGSCKEPVLQQSVSAALLHQGTLFAHLGRNEEALEAFEEVVRRNRAVPAAESPGAVALALLNKGCVLNGLKRFEDASAVWEMIAKKFEGSNEPMLRNAAAMALCESAEFELANGRADEAVELVQRVFEKVTPIPGEIKLQGYLVAARAYFVGGEIDECAKTLKSLLAFLPGLGTIPKQALDGLFWLSINLGPDRMCELIDASPARDLLLPLTTALKQETGLHPRVAQEVKEIAKDIRRDLEAIRTGTSAAGDAWAPSLVQTTLPTLTSDWILATMNALSLSVSQPNSKQDLQVNEDMPVRTRG